MSYTPPTVLKIEPAENLYIEFGVHVYTLNVAKQGVFLARQSIHGSTIIATAVLADTEAFLLINYVGTPRDRRPESLADIAAILETASSHVAARSAQFLANLAVNLRAQIAASS